MLARLLPMCLVVVTASGDRSDKEHDGVGSNKATVCKGCVVILLKS